jgi:hypothetical protein
MIWYPASSTTFCTAAPISHTVLPALACFIQAYKASLFTLIISAQTGFLSSQPITIVTPESV